MGIGLVYDRANKDAYDLLSAITELEPGGDIAEYITNTVFPTLLNKVGDTIIRVDSVSRNYDRFKLPLSEYGAITEYLMSNMARAANAEGLSNGDIVNDFVVKHPEIGAVYAHRNVKANYPMTVASDKWLEALDGQNVRTLAQMIAIAMQSLYDGITHDHDSFIPALFGTFYTLAKGNKPDMIRNLPVFSGSDVEDYAKAVFATMSKAVRDMTTWRRPDLNLYGYEMGDRRDDLVLVAFENPAAEGTDGTIMDIISSHLNFGATARARALGEALGVAEVYEMPSAGIITSNVARAYSITNLPGMQTADTLAGTQTAPHPELMFALVGKGALNVGLKRLQKDTGRSIRGHFDQTWVEPTLQLAFGAGQAIFFAIPTEDNGGGNGEGEGEGEGNGEGEGEGNNGEG